MEKHNNLLISLSSNDFKVHAMRVSCQYNNTFGACWTQKTRIVEIGMRLRRVDSLQPEYGTSDVRCRTESRICTELFILGGERWRFKGINYCRHIFQSSIELSKVDTQYSIKLLKSIF